MKISGQPLEETENTDENTDDEDFQSPLTGSIQTNTENTEEVIENEGEEEEEPPPNVGNELAQELRAAFELYSKVSSDTFL